MKIFRNYDDNVTGGFYTILRIHFWGEFKVVAYKQINSMYYV